MNTPFITRVRELIEREIAEHLAGRTGPSAAAHLMAARDVPFD